MHSTVNLKALFAQCVVQETFLRYGVKWNERASTLEMFNAQGELHCEDGPAVVLRGGPAKGGDEEYWVDGELFWKSSEEREWAVNTVMEVYHRGGIVL